MTSVITLTGDERATVYCALTMNVREDLSYLATNLRRAVESPAGSRERGDALDRALQFSVYADEAAALARRMVPGYREPEVRL